MATSPEQGIKGKVPKEVLFIQVFPGQQESETRRQWRRRVPGKGKSMHRSVHSRQGMLKGLDEVQYAGVYVLE